MDPSLISDMMKNPKMMKTMEEMMKNPEIMNSAMNMLKNPNMQSLFSGLNVPEMEKAYKADLANDSSTENETTTQESTENAEQKESTENAEQKESTENAEQQESTENPEQQEFNETTKDESSDIIEVKDEITGDTIIKPNPENMSQEPENMDDEMFAKLLNDEKFSEQFKNIDIDKYLKNKKRNTLCLEGDEVVLKDLKNETYNNKEGIVQRFIPKTTRYEVLIKSLNKSLAVKPENIVLKKDLEPKDEDNEDNNDIECVN